MGTVPRPCIDSRLFLRGTDGGYRIDTSAGQVTLRLVGLPGDSGGYERGRLAQDPRYNR
jgi:hypothetical protein